MSKRNLKRPRRVYINYVSPDKGTNSLGPTWKGLVLAALRIKKDRLSITEVCSELVEGLDIEPKAIYSSVYSSLRSLESLELVSRDRKGLYRLTLQGSKLGPDGTLTKLRASSDSRLFI